MIKSEKVDAFWRPAFDLLDSGKDLLVFDFETTGFHRRDDRIIEVAAIRYRVLPDYRLSMVDIFQSLVNPHRPLTQDAIEVTHITDDMLIGQPTEYQLLPRIQELFDDAVLVGHNINVFDLAFIQNLYARYGLTYECVGTIDTMRMVKACLDKELVKSHKLTDVGAYYGFDFEAHRAMNDTGVTVKLLELFVQHYRPLYRPIGG